MKDFKKLIKEAYLGNPLNESVSPSTRIHYVASPAPRKMLAKELEDLFGDDYRNIVTEFQDDGGYESVLIFNLTDSDIERIEDEIGDVLIGEYSLKKVKEIQEALHEEDRATKVDMYLSGEEEYPEFDPQDVIDDLENEDKLPDGFHSKEDLDQFLKDNPFDSEGYKKLSIAQKQDILSYLNRDTEKEFERRMAAKRVNENKFEKGDKIVYRGGNPGKVVHVFDKKSFINPEVEYKIRYKDLDSGNTNVARVRGKDIALEKDLDDMGRKYFGKDYDLEEDINDPALVKARAAQMKKDQRDREEAEYEAKQAALDKKYGSSFMDKLDAEISLKQELQDLKDERAQLMIDMEQEAEPEGGEIADLYGMKLNRIDLRTAEIKDELDDLRMYESVNEDEIDEDNGGAKQDFTLNINNPGAESHALDDEVNKMGYSESLQESLRKKLQDRLK